MGWVESTFEDWGELQACLCDLAKNQDLLCRGQPSDFDGGRVLSSLDRDWNSAVPEDRKPIVEREIAEKFRQHAPNYLSLAELEHLNDGPSFWMLMQHYGAPTRLVDWTQSIWVAAYFAVRAEPKEEGIIWVFDGQDLDRHAHEKHHHETRFIPLSSPTDGLPHAMWCSFDPWVCRLTTRGHMIPRMIAQQGLFTVAGRLGVDHIEAIDQVIPNSELGVGKHIIRIAFTLKPTVLNALHRMGINGSTLFPGIDGVGKFLSELAQIKRSP